jgi:hypothetical protein
MGLLRQHEAVDWIRLAQDRNNWRSVVDTIITFVSLQMGEPLD